MNSLKSLAVLALSITAISAPSHAQVSHADNMRAVRGFTLGETCEDVQAKLEQAFKTPGTEFFGQALHPSGKCDPKAGSLPTYLSVYFTRIGIPHESSMSFIFGYGSKLVQVVLHLGWESPNTAPLINMTYQRSVELYGRPYFGIDLGPPDRGGANGPFTEAYWTTSKVKPAATRIQPAITTACYFGKPTPIGMVCGPGVSQKMAKERDAARYSAAGVGVQLKLKPFEESASGRVRMMHLQVTDVDGHSAATAAYRRHLNKLEEQNVRNRESLENSRLPSF